MLGTPDRDFPTPGTVLDLIATTHGDPYLSWTEVVSDDELVVSAPKDASLRPVSIPVGEQVDLVWKEAGELRSLPVTLVFVEPGEQPRWHLRPVGLAKRGQRRDAVRAPLSVPVELGVEPSLFEATSVDLSEGGLRCILAKRQGRVPAGGDDLPAAEPPQVGDVVRVTAVLPDATITCLAEIARRHPRDDGRVELSVRFISLREDQQDLIRKRVFTRLRELRRRGLL